MELDGKTRHEQSLARIAALERELGIGEPDQEEKIADAIREVKSAHAKLVALRNVLTYQHYSSAFWPKDCAESLKILEQRCKTAQDKVAALYLRGPS